MLRAALANWLRPAPANGEPEEGRSAFHSDLRAIRPDAWATRTPAARGREVEQAMWLAGVSTRDFRETIDITLSPHLVTPTQHIVDLCVHEARTCRERADVLALEVPPLHPSGRPPLPWHRQRVREARDLYRAARSWEALAGALLNNRWPE